MGIIKNKINEKIDYKNLTKYTNTVGTITKINNITNTCTITFNNPNGEGMLVRENVPVSSNLGGFTSSGLKIGTICDISFSRGNIYAPVITGIVDSFYNQKTCTDQGCTLIDDEMKEFSFNEEITPMYEQWLLNKSEHDIIYSDAIEDFSSIDVNEKIYNFMSEVDKYSENEIGITNLNTKSTIKLKENGDIDLFVSDNVGIRISKKNKKIYIYGKLEHDCCCCCNCNGNSNNNNNSNSSNSDDDVGKILDTLNLDIEELKKCIARTGEIHGEPESFDKLNANIQKFESLYENYNSGMYNNGNEDTRIAMKNEVMKLYNYFCKELAAGRLKWGLD